MSALAYRIFNNLRKSMTILKPLKTTGWNRLSVPDLSLVYMALFVVKRRNGGPFVRRNPSEVRDGERSSFMFYLPRPTK